MLQLSTSVSDRKLLDTFDELAGFGEMASIAVGEPLVPKDCLGMEDQRWRWKVSLAWWPPFGSARVAWEVAARTFKLAKEGSPSGEGSEAESNKSADARL